MNKRVLGIFIQIIGLALWIFLPINIVIWRAVVGIIIIIAGGVIYREATGAEKTRKTILETIFSATAIVICLIIVGLLVTIVVPNFIKGYQDGRYQAEQRRLHGTQGR